MTLMHGPRLAPALLLLLAGCTTVDNSGGPPPDGDSVPFALSEDPPVGFCGFADDAVLIDSTEAIDAWAAECDDLGGNPRAPVDAAFAALGPDETLVLVTAQLGGCLMGVEFPGVFLDGTTLNVWMRKQDSSYGRANAACTDDLGVSYDLLVVQDASEATEVALNVSVYNPQLPGAPAGEE